MTDLLTCKTTGRLSGSTLKLIACVAMFVDHFGLVVFPKMMIFRIIGRLAFPIFAFFIAEGCKYTRNRLKHFLLIFSVGIIYFFFYLFAYGEIYPSIFLTFSVSILNIYLIDALKIYAFVSKTITENHGGTNEAQEFIEGDEVQEISSIASPRVKLSRVALASIVMMIALGISYIPFHFVVFDYGYIGMLAPVLMSLVDFSKIKTPQNIQFLDTVPTRLIILAVALVGIAVRNPALKTEIFGFRFTIQVFNLMSLPILALYNGKVGTKKLKYFFYAFYPLHLGVIMVIKYIMDLILS